MPYSLWNDDELVGVQLDLMVLAVYEQRHRGLALGNENKLVSVAMAFPL